jgi:hypothetical protein
MTLAPEISRFTWSVALAMAWATWAAGDEFRVDSMVFREGDSDAICQNVTLFVGDRVYDELHGSSPEITIVDVSKAIMIVLDPTNRRRTELSFPEIANFVATTNESARSSRSFVRFAANPDFERTYDDATGLLELIGTDLKYRASTIAATPEASAQFRVFADWSARLNTLRPGLPPNARLALNAALASKQRLPSEIRRVILLPDGENRELSSRHDFTWQLAAEDRQRIARFEAWAIGFSPVDLKTLWDLMANTSGQ